MPDKSKNNNKTILITGSGRGIGRQIARDFAAAGYSVAGVDIKPGPAETFLKEYLLDVSDAAAVEKIFMEIQKDFPAIDILINNAGIMQDEMFTKMDFATWDAVLKTNLYGPFNVTKQVLPGMIERNWGRVINISSIIGLTGNYGQTNYAAAKSGLLGLTKSLAKEVARNNITVNAICPGLIDTDMIKDVPPEHMDKMLSKIPARRLGETEEISKLAFFLASDDSGYITGSLVNINGGWL